MCFEDIYSQIWHASNGNCILLNQMCTTRRFFSGLLSCLQGRGTTPNESEPENTTEKGRNKCSCVYWTF